MRHGGVLTHVPRCVAQRASAPLNVDDLYNVREVRDPQRSPDGKWVAYTVARAIKETDKNDTDVWMVSWDGTAADPGDLDARTASRGRAGAPTASILAFLSRPARERRAPRSGC